MRYRLYMYTPRSSEASCFPDMRQHVHHGHRYRSGVGIRVRQLQAF